MTVSTPATRISISQPEINPMLIKDAVTKHAIAKKRSGPLKPRRPNSKTKLRPAKT